ncbi:hypothetical protein [Novosphingobium sp. FKTRR1]|uniref:hypothetical protein n=1 Tax=Novosphingobium sp. FKTRR1 TaxID=2879118 RepID=UPI001CF022A0|nr:hypothetical protein [Novosphingobium sp. FKTRR1]
MTVSVSISVNGNYKVPVSFKQGEREENHVVSGRGLDQPNVQHIAFYHGPDVMTLVVGPEEPDHGEGEE